MHTGMQILSLLAVLASITQAQGSTPTASNLLACASPAPLCSITFVPSMPAAQRRCERPGIVLKPTNEDVAPVAACIADSYTECRDQCLQSHQDGDKCDSFNYDIDTGTCNTSPKTPQQQDFTAVKNSSIVFTAGRCYNANYLLTYQGFNFKVAGSGMTATAHYLGQSSQAPPVQPSFITSIQYGEDDACGAAEACIEQGVEQLQTTDSLIDVHYLPAQGAWECTGWTAYDEIGAMYSANSSAGAYYLFATVIGK